MASAGKEGGVTGECRARKWAEPAGEAEVERANGFAIHLIQALWYRVGDDQKRCIITRIVRSYWTPGPHCQAPTAGSGLILHLARHGRAVELPCTEHHDMNGLAQNSRAVFRRRAEGRACPFGHPRRSAVGAGQCACSVRTPRSLSGLGRAACLCLMVIASRRRCNDARDVLSRLREILVAEVASEGRW